MAQEEIPTRATSDESITEISSEDDLLAALGVVEDDNDDTEKPGDTKEPEDTKKPSEESDDEEIDEETGLPKSLLLGEDDKDIKDDKEKTDDTPDEKEFNNMVEFINDKYDLKLNVDQLPKDMTREEEATLVAQLYDNVVEGANTKLNEFKEVSELLEDKEVAEFIAAKRSGKTLKDFVTEYAGTTAGKSDEEIVKDSIRSTAPTMSDDDLNDVIQTLKEKGKLETMATEARNKTIADEELSKKEREEKEKLQAEQFEKERLEEVQKYSEYVGKISSVHGVPLDAKMKKELIVATTQPDKEGLTYLERALQSDLGVVRATIGLLYLERLMDASKTTNKNKVRNDLMEKLIADPEKLQSRKSVETTEEFDADIANSF